MSVFIGAIPKGKRKNSGYYEYLYKGFKFVVVLVESLDNSRNWYCEIYTIDGVLVEGAHDWYGTKKRAMYAAMHYIDNPSLYR